MLSAVRTSSSRLVDDSEPRRSALSVLTRSPGSLRLPRAGSDQKFAEPVALSSTQPADRPLPRRALRLGFDLVALRARRKEEPKGSGKAGQVGHRRERGRRFHRGDGDGPDGEGRFAEVWTRTVEPPPYHVPQRCRGWLPWIAKCLQRVPLRNARFSADRAGSPPLVSTVFPK